VPWLPRKLARVSEYLSRLLQRLPILQLQILQMVLQMVVRTRMPEQYPTELCKLADKYGSDKSPAKRWHSYTLYYHNLLKSRREDIKSILEIGLGCRACFGGDRNYENYVDGASLYMWRDYFPRATVYGIDINQNILFNEDRIKTFYCDQSSVDQLEKLKEEIGPFDIIVDDGSHILQHQLISAGVLIPSVKPNGFYIIEDVQNTAIDSFISLSNFLNSVRHVVPSSILDSYDWWKAELELVRIDGRPHGYVNNCDNNLAIFHVQPCAVVWKQRESDDAR
jgi:hypothetical protein